MEEKMLHYLFPILETRWVESSFIVYVVCTGSLVRELGTVELVEPGSAVVD
jgi:hypothetical protein